MKKNKWILITIIWLFTINACGLRGPAVWKDPSPFDDKNTVWIYESESMQIYFFPKVYDAYIYKGKEVKLVDWSGLLSAQNMEVRDKENHSVIYFDGTYRATEDKFWLLNDYGLDQNNLFTEEEMEAEPTFYRYYMDDLPEDTPQEVLDYIAELEMEEENIAD